MKNKIILNMVNLPYMPLNCHTRLPGNDKREEISRQITLISTIFFCLMSHTLTAHSSLFFTDEEIAFIEENKYLTASPGKVSLSAILFHDKNNWSIWIGDKVIHPGNVCELKGFRIEKVMPDGVKISRLSPDGSILETFILHPYEDAG